MINQFNERITYNEQTEKVSWTTLADTYTLPSQYKEVEYIENCNGCKHGTTVTGGRIVLDAFKNNRTKPCRERFFPYIITDEFKTSVPLFFIIKHHNSFNFTQTQDIRLNPIVYFGL